MIRSYVTITITKIANATYETPFNLPTRLGLMNCTQKVVIEKCGEVANCYVSYYLNDGVAFYTYELLNFTKYLSKVKKINLNLFADEIINRADAWLMAA